MHGTLLVLCQNGLIFAKSANTRFWASVFLKKRRLLINITLYLEKNQMTPVQIAILSLRLLAIFTLIDTIPYLMSLTEAFAWKGVALAGDRQFNTDLILIGTILSLVLQFSIGLFLFVYAKRLAKRMIAEEESEKSSTELSAKNIQTIAFSVVGLIMIVIAIPHIAQFAVNLQALKNAGAETLKRSISIGTWAYSIGILIQFIFGIILFLGARGLSSLWYFFQKLRPMKDVQ